jgi:hypothetical protein
VEDVAGSPHGGGLAHLGEASVGPAALHPRVDAERLTEAELEREDVEPAAFGQEAGEPLPYECVLLDKMRALTDGDDACVADERAKRLEVVERRGRVEGGKRNTARPQPSAAGTVAQGERDAQRDCLRASDL